ncbi:MAG: AEC family transporter [Leptolyngbyaceae cyanobacterium bins.349]|nr:AEC family transporter [Leptolyngbyaceae cyanobacterium bins.349]
MPIAKLLEIYLPLIGWTGLGWVIGPRLPATVPVYMGKFLFWFGVPLGIVAFLRHAEVSWALWIAPVTAWCAILGGIGLARLYLIYQNRQWSRRTQTSFTLTSMVGNTGYIGFPVALVLVGPQHFAWAVFYDMVGSTLGAYGLGVALAAQAQAADYDPESCPTANRQSLIGTMAINPVFWSFGLGLLGRDLPLPPWLETSLRAIAWGVIALALVLIGIRLSQITSFKNVRPATISLTIKMVVVPLLVGMALRSLGITGDVHRVLLLQMAMPPAFATLVISEAYALDQEMAVTAIAIGSVLLLITLPVWLWLFP